MALSKLSHRAAHQFDNLPKSFPYRIVHRNGSDLFGMTDIFMKWVPLVAGIDLLNTVFRNLTVHE